MKRILILALALIFVFVISLAITSCGDNSNDTSSKNDSNVTNDTNTDTSSDTSTDTDTSVDTSTDTDSGVETDTDTDNEPEKPDLPEIDSEVKKKAEALLESKHKLTYNEDGSFKILILADLHMQTGNDSARQAVKDRIKNTVDKTNPNLVIFTGDNTLYSDTEEKLRANIDIIAGYLEEKHIPWCHVYGNHDYENKALSKHDQNQIYQSYEYCISKDIEEISSGQSNYIHAVYNPDGTIGSAIYFFDSGEYSRYTYGFIQEDQINWYKDTSMLLQEYNYGTVVPSIMAFHIPLIENRYAYENRGDTEIVYSWEGHRNEPIHSAECDTELLETIWERGDVKAIITGHDHRNDYSYNYKGVYLMSCPNISELGYTDDDVQGSRVIDINLNTINGEIPTYIERIKERANPDNFDTYEDNISLEINNELVQGTHKGDGGYGTASGKCNVTYKDGKGKDGGSAIEIVRGNSNTFDLFIDIANPGKVGSNKYFMLWADFTQTEFNQGCFGLITEHGDSLPFSTLYSNSPVTFYYLPDGETEWQELSLGDNGYFGVEEANSQGVNGLKGYFAFSLDTISQDLVPLTSDTVITGIYFKGSVKNNLKFIDKPFYICEFQLVTDYKNN